MGRLKAQLERAERELEELRPLRIKVVELEGEIRQLKTDAAQAEAEKQRLREQAERAEQKAAERQKQIDQLTADLDPLQQEAPPPRRAVWRAFIKC